MPPKAKVTTVEKDTQDVVVEKKAVKKVAKEPAAEKEPKAEPVVKATKKAAKEPAAEAEPVVKVTKKAAKEPAAEAEPKVEGEAEAEDESKRGSDAIGLLFPPSRVKLHINRYINGVLDAELAVLKEEMKKDETKKNFYEDKCHALTRAKTRFADIAPTVMALVLDSMVRGIAHEGMNYALNVDDKKTVTIKHVLAGSVNSELAALFVNLPVFVAASKKVEEPEPVEEAEAAEPVKNDDAEEVLTDRSKFNSYISKVFTAVKSQTNSTMRVASGTIHFMNELVISTIQRLCGMLRVLLEVKGAKTVDSDMVMYAVQLALNDGHVASNTLEYGKEMQKQTDKDTAVKEDKEVVVVHVKVDYVTSAYNKLNKHVEAKVLEYNQWRDNKEAVAANAREAAAKVEAPVAV